MALLVFVEFNVVSDQENRANFNQLGVVFLRLFLAAVTRFNFYLGKFEITIVAARLVPIKRAAVIVISNLRR